MSDTLALFSLLDFIAVGFLLICWLLVSFVIESPPARYPSTSTLMAVHRREWMRQMVMRHPRIFDAQIIASLRQGTAFFASASMIAVGGGVALMGNADQLQGVAEDFTLGNEPVLVWEIKLLLMTMLAANAFLKFVWSNRLFGYCSVLMGAVPNEASDPNAFSRAAQAAEINVTAARGYNRGLRSVYFGIAAIAWLAGAVPLLIATALTLAVILRREFASQSRRVLLEGNTAD